MSNPLKKFFRRPKVHFLHIPKTGGSAIKYTLKSILKPTGEKRQLSARKYIVQLQKHRTTLAQIPQGEQVICVLREPGARFISAFYSRQRQGRPRYSVPWKEIEEKTFTAFATPNMLLKAYVDPLSSDHELSVEALSGIGHFRPQTHWLGKLAAFKQRESDILFLGFQESLDQDFDRLAEILELPRTIKLPEDAEISHRTPDSVDRALAPDCREALKGIYGDDYELIDYCKQKFAGHSQVESAE